MKYNKQIWWLDHNNVRRKKLVRKNALRRYCRDGAFDNIKQKVGAFVAEKIDLVKAKVAFIKYVINLTKPVIQDLVTIAKSVVGMVRRIKFARDAETLKYCAKQIFVIGDTLRNRTARALLEICKELFPQNEPNYQAAIEAT